MNEVKLPIETTKEGYKTTKVCVEDCYKLINKIYESLNRSYNKSVEILEGVHKKYNEYEGELIIGTGISQPCLKDAYDEEIGSSIAFMKAKLNANLKKARIIEKITHYLWKTLVDLSLEFDKLRVNIQRDVNNIRMYNPEFRPDLDKYLDEENHN